MLLSSKRCVKCKEIKNVNDFYSDRRNKDGKRSYCKKCWYISNRKNWLRWVENNKEKIKEYQRRQRIKRELHPRIKRPDIGFSPATIGRYGYNTLKTLKETKDWKCIKCGSIKDLTIHHTDHNGINKLKQKKYSEINNNIDNLEIICRSCHGAYHIKQRWNK